MSLRKGLCLCVKVYVFAQRFMFLRKGLCLCPKVYVFAQRFMFLPKGSPKEIKMDENQLSIFIV
jgi:hypothetical protein